MNQLGKFREALAMYRKHDWQLVRVLMRPESLAELRAETAGEPARWEEVAVEEAPFDAMWFKRAAAGGREAWELRLVADPPYALFELFEAEEADEDREDVRREMEARLREYVAPRT